MSHRTGRCSVVAVTIVLAVNLTGCGQKDTPPQRAAPVGSTDASAPAVQPQGTPAAAPEAAVPATDFDAGLQEVLRLESDAEFSKALRLCRELRSEFRAHKRADEFDELSLRLREGARAGIGLKVFIQNLAASDMPTRQAARDHLSESGDPGRILLRRAVRIAEGDLVIESAAILARMKDVGAIAPSISRLQGDVDVAIASSVGGILRSVAPDLSGDHLKACHAMIRDDSAFARKAVAGALQAVFDDACGGNATSYDDRVGRPGALRELRSYIEAAVASGDAEVQQWVCDEGGSSASYVHSLRGRYYLGRDHDPRQIDREQFDTIIKFYNDSFRYTSNRYTDISVRWDGYIDVPADGDYAFDLIGDDRIRIWIDEALVAESKANVAVKTNRTLAAGLRAVRIDYMNAGSTASLEFSWTPPGAPRAIVLPYRASPRLAMLTNLQASVAALATNDLKVIRSAKYQLGRGGGTSRILLRDAVAHASPTVARRSCELLVELRDSRTPGVILARLQSDPATPLRLALYDALRDLGARIPAELYGALLADLREATDYTMRSSAVALCGILESTRSNAAEEFNEKMGDAKAYDDLKAYVATCLEAEEKDTVKLAAAFGTPFAPYLPGLEAHFYLGYRFDEHSTVRRANRVHLGNRAWPMPEARQDDVAVRYSGLLTVTNADAYAFQLRSDHPGSVRLGEMPVLWSRGHTWRQSTNKLEVGVYAFEAATGSPSGNNRIESHWETPAGKGVGAFYSTRPWFDALKECEAAVLNLTSTNPAIFEPARQMLQHFDPVGRAVLRHALRTGTPETAGEAARILARHRDASAVPLIIARMNDATIAASDPFVESLVLLADLIPPESVAALAAALPAGEWKDSLPRAAVLSSILDVTYGANAAAFDKGAGRPDLASQFKPYFEQLMISESLTNAAWAVQYGGAFAPRMNGLHAQYFLGRNFDTPVVDYRLGSTSIANRRFPIPGGRQDNISARWTGFLNIDKPGEYTFDLVGDDRAVLWLDGEKRAVSTANVVASAKVTLKQGRAPIRVDYQQTGSSAILDLQWSGPGITRTVISGTALQANARLSQFEYLTASVEKLVPLTDAQSAAGDNALLAYGDTGRLVARNAFRHAADPVSVAGAGFLRRHVDPEFGAIAVQRLSSTPSALVTASVVSHVVRYTNTIETADLAGLHDLVMAEKKHDLRGLALLFDRVLTKECAGKADAFAKRVGRAKALETLQDYVRGGAASTDKAIADWFIRYTGDLYPVLGVTAAYFTGANFETPLKQGLAAAVSIDPKSFPYADPRPEQVSARWTGYVRTPASGSYTFKYTGIGTTQLWINNAAVGNGAGVNLNGVHELKFELSQSTNATATLTWSGPGIPKEEPIPQSALRTLP
ncbi:MAG: PA14 domain-containing protein [Verrucomicrobia bacterium]|nr:PA14 domain-containing protein [Verrucomicrobiota bacterium]MDA1086153.1 PA14 domain-containing protein [Verrucomicrobiota bacterium]